MTYANGQIPYSVMEKAQAGLYLTPLAAESWQNIVAGVQSRFGWTPQLTDAYRDLYGYYGQEQTFLRRYQRGYVQYFPGKVDRRVWNGVAYYRKPGNAAAAVPGTSNHGWATAVDVTGLGAFGSSRFNQFAAVAIANGWSNAEGRSVNEPWHWTRNSLSFANHPNQSTGGNVPIVPDVDPIVPIEPILEDDMKFVRDTDGAIYLLAPGQDKRHLDQQEWALWTRVGAELDGDGFLPIEVQILANTLNG